MVNISTIPIRFAHQFNMTHKTFKEQVKRINGYKKMTQTHVIDALTHLLAFDESEREKKVQAEHGVTSHIVGLSDVGRRLNDNPYNFGEKKDIPKNGKLFVIFIKPKEDGKDQIELPPRPQQQLPSDDNKKHPLPVLPDSEGIMDLISLIRKYFRPTFGGKRVMDEYRKNLKKAISNISLDEKTSEYIYNHLDIRQVEVRNSDNYLLYYVKKNGHLDFGDFVIDRFCVEAKCHVNDQKKGENNIFGCFFRCIIDQSSKRVVKGRKLKRLGYLDKQEDGKTNFVQMEKVAGELSLDIVVLDIELKTIKEFNYCLNERRNNLVVLVVKDNHVYNLKPEYKKFISRSGAHSLIGGITGGSPSVDPILSEDIPLLPPDVIAYVSFSLFNNNIESSECEEEVTTTWEDEGLDSTIINLQTGEEVKFDRKEDITYVLYCCNNIMNIYKYYYLRRKITGQLLENGNNLQLVVQEKNGAIVYFRDRSFFDFDKLYPAKWTFSVSSLSKNLFRRFITESIPKVSDPIIGAVLKEFCKPIKHVKIGNYVGGGIYYFDLRKAYFNSSDDLWIPDNDIIYGRNIGRSNSTDVALYLTSKNEEWKMEVSDDEEWIAHVPILSRTNTIREYGEWLRDSAPSEVSESYKLFFNSLIGSMHPTDSAMAYSLIFHNELDFWRFLMLKEGKNIVDIDIDDEISIYRVRFTYDDTLYQSGLWLPYFPAQIMYRCNKKVMDFRKKLSDMGHNVIMTMTDSCVVQCCHHHGGGKLDDQILKDADDAGWVLKLKADVLDVRAVGRYRFWDENGRVIGGTSSYSVYPSNNGKDLNTGLDTFNHVKTNVPISESMGTMIKHRLVTGGAGDGKTRWIRKNYWDRNSGDFILVATTGIASSILDTKTLHSTFCMTRGESLTAIDAVKKLSKTNILKFQKAITIVIDEAFMARDSDMLMVDKILRMVCCSSAPFGGKQLVLVGDERQLNSVKGNPFIGSRGGLYERIKENFEPVKIEYNPVKSRMVAQYKYWTDRFRRTDWGGGGMRSIKILLREGLDKFSKEHIDGGLTCFFRNVEVDAYNESKRLYKSKILDGEPIILRRNIDIKKGLFNGKIGVAKWLEGGGDKTKILGFAYTRYGDEGKSEHIHKLNSLQFKEDYFLAYAITIHKSQGLTLDTGINIGIRGLFSSRIEKDVDSISRLLYVALTRVRDFNKVHIF